MFFFYVFSFFLFISSVRFILFWITIASYHTLSAENKESMKPQKRNIIMPIHQLGNFVSGSGCRQIQRVISIIRKTLNRRNSNTKSGDNRFQVCTKDINWLIIIGLLGVVATFCIVPDTPIVCNFRIPCSLETFPK